MDIKLSHVLKIQNDVEPCLAMHGDRLVTGGRTLRVWSISTGKLLTTLQGHTTTLFYSVAIEGDIIVGGGEDQITAWNINAPDTPMFTTMQTLTLGVVTSVAISGDTFVSASANKTVKIWDKNTGSLIYNLDIQRWVSAVAIDGKTVATTTIDAIDLWDKDTGEHVRTLAREVEASNPNGLAIQNDMIASCEGAFIIIWDKDTGDQILRLSEDKMKFVDVKFSGELIVAGAHGDGDDASIIIWDKTGLLLESWLVGPNDDQEDFINSIAVFENHVAVAYDSENLVELYKLSIPTKLVAVPIIEMIKLLVQSNVVEATEMWNNNPEFKTLITARSIGKDRNVPKLISTYTSNAAGGFRISFVEWFLKRGMDPFQPFNLFESDEEFIARETNTLKRQHPNASASSISLQVKQNLEEAKMGPNLFSSTKKEFEKRVYANYVNYVLEQFLKELQILIVDIITNGEATEDVCRKVKNQTLWNLEQYIGNNLIKVPNGYFNYERLAALKSAIYNTIESLTAVCGKAPIQSELVGVQPSDCYDLTDQQADRVLIQFHFKGFPKRKTVCVTLNQLLLGGYGGGTAEFRQWYEEDLPVTYEKQLKSIEQFAAQKPLTKWRVAKNTNTVLDTGAGSEPSSLRGEMFIEFDVNSGEFIQGDSNRVCITLNSWNSFIRKSVLLIASGKRVIHACATLIGNWRSGNIKGTAMSSEIHAQSETSVKPVYHIYYCMPEDRSVNVSRKKSKISSPTENDSDDSELDEVNRELAHIETQMTEARRAQNNQQIMALMRQRAALIARKSAL